MNEFELTYLVKEFPKDLKKSLSKEMVDIYLPSTAEHPDLRIRKSGDRYEITRKRPAQEGDASHQIEITIQLSKEEFRELSLVPGKRVEKTRYMYEGANAVMHEIDVFGGELKGLVLADVEFDSPDAKSKFTMPEWCLAEVTQEKFLAGGMLCGKTYKDIEKDLARFDYKKLTIK